ncbi:hypothetical protein DFS34DRAFT_646018 [Phlyctochytrium arcticum]|nr:hypothetical protein DFS34DRAFT_646018 [Phlyctochytrium arcticum]
MANLYGKSLVTNSYRLRPADYETTGPDVDNFLYYLKYLYHHYQQYKRGLPRSDAEGAITDAKTHLALIQDLRAGAINRGIERKELKDMESTI